MMVGTWVAIMLLINKWVDKHGLTMQDKVSKCISSTNSTVVQILGITRMSLLLVATWEVDLVIVCHMFKQLLPPTAVVLCALKA